MITLASDLASIYDYIDVITRLTLLSDITTIDTRFDGTDLKLRLGTALLASLVEFCKSTSYCSLGDLAPAQITALDR